MTCDRDAAAVPAAEVLCTAEILEFPITHTRASPEQAGTQSGRAARRTSKLAVTPAAAAFSDARTADHHSSGIRSLWDHLRTAVAGAPTSDAISANDGQRSMICLKEVATVMRPVIGQIVPLCKDYLSTDWGKRLGHNVSMGTDDDQIDSVEKAWRHGFRQRLKEARGERTQEKMAKLLGMRGPNATNTYGKYEGSRASMMPVRLLPLFCDICGVSLEWLINGPSEVELAQSKEVASEKGSPPAKRLMKNARK